MDARQGDRYRVTITLGPVDRPLLPVMRWLVIRVIDAIRESPVDIDVRIERLDAPT